MKIGRHTLLATALCALMAGCPRSPEPGSEPTNEGYGNARAGENGDGIAVQQNAPPAVAPIAPAAPPPVVAPTAPASSGPVHTTPALRDPALATETAPATYSVELVTTKGPIRIDVTRAWAPNGADRFYNLVRAGFFTDVAFFRVIGGFMAQCGIHGDPGVSRAWSHANIPDDPVGQQHNTRGMVSYAMAGPNTRTSQFFISFGDNSSLDGMGFAPFGRVRDMAPVDALYSGYGEGAPSGRGPAQSRLQREGNAYLRAEFPQLDYIQRASVIER